MKRNLLPILVSTLILVSVILVSCKKDNNNNPTDNKSLTCEIKHPVNNQKIEPGATVNILVEAVSQNSSVIGVSFLQMEQILAVLQILRIILIGIQQVKILVAMK